MLDILFWKNYFQMALKDDLQTVKADVRDLFFQP